MRCQSAARSASMREARRRIIHFAPRTVVVKVGAEGALALSAGGVPSARASAASNAPCR
jgi:hypothetical protein